MNFKPKIRAPRMWDWLLATVALLLMVWWVAPQQLQIVVYKVALVSIAACMTYWIDRSLFARVKDRLLDEAVVIETANSVLRNGFNVIRRALIFVGCVLGLSLGV